MFEVISQILIAVTGGIAVYLSQQNNDRLKKFACLFGLVSQPFWWFSTLQSQQYGMFLLTLLYTYSWCLGVYNNWINCEAKP